MNYIVFIQIHGEAEKLFSCLESLSVQSLLPEIVVIVDDGTPNDSVYWQFKKHRHYNTFEPMRIDYFRGSKNKEPDLDTVGLSITKAWYIYSDPKHSVDYLSIIDVDSRPETTYYQTIIEKMDADPDLICASGVIRVDQRTEELISAKIIKRKDARGSGKVIRTDFLLKIPFMLFPEVAWDTWINTKAKQAGKKALQIPNAVLYSSRSTTRLTCRNNFRDGRLTYHFGYNVLLLVYKILFRGREVLKGYRDAKRKNWRLADEEVRKWFGWRYLLHFWK